MGKLPIAHLRVYRDKNTASLRIIAENDQYGLVAVTTHYFEDDDREKRACVAQIRAHLLCAGYQVDSSEVDAP